MPSLAPTGAQPLVWCGCGKTRLAARREGRMPPSKGLRFSRAATMANREGNRMATGMSEERLARIAGHIDHYVEEGRFPGAACLVSRGGEETFFHATGLRDVEREVPVSRDTVFRLYSMTKPITSVALMMLYEEGRFQLDDPVSKYIEAWSDLEVFADGDEEHYLTRKPDSPMTIKHLLTHTSGLTYGFMNEHPVDVMYGRARVTGSDSGGTLNDTIEKLARIPLKFAPGTQWNYGVSTDVCGYLVEQFSGQALDEFVAERIAAPLGMVDSGFHVRSGAEDRFAACYQYVAPATYRLQDDPESSRYLERPTFFSGGGGMVCTLDANSSCA
ncbi:MAG: beta-lactamase family protein, partial [Gammaproteobacteria bacterium]|nr:beta-lactamase family protein [Gammaproteobacteria bacterium]